MLIAIALISAICACQATATPVDVNSSVPLIPRKKLFGNPDFTYVRMSADAKLIAYLAPYKDVINLWVQPLDHVLKKQQTAKPVTFDQGRGIENFQWTYMPGILIYAQDKDGDENWRLWKVNVTQEPFEVTVLSDTKGVQANIESKKPSHPEYIIIGLNDRDQRYHDLYTVDLKSGKKKKIFVNDHFGGFVFDNDMTIRLAFNETDNAETVYYKAIWSDKQDKIIAWEVYRNVSHEDSIHTYPRSFDKSNKNVYWLDATKNDLGVLYIAPFDSPLNRTVLYTPQKSEISDIFDHPTEYTVMAVYENYLKLEIFPTNDTVRKDIKYLNTASKDGQPDIVQSSLDFSKWLLVYHFDNKPLEYHLYDRTTKHIQFLFTTRKQMEGLKLSHMHGVEVKTRDGLTQLCYLSLPVEADPHETGRPLRPLPMVLSVHGGPWYRDEWGLNQAVQLFTNRGYAVLQCNYRGSTGFGRRFHIAGYGEWAGKMHDDLIDAVKWAIEQKIAIANKVAIEGGSYGGYAALVGLSFTPDVFACAVDEVGPSNLLTLLETIPAYWRPAFNSDTKRIGGDPRTEEGKKALLAKSPITFVNKIVKPLLIAQGANDPRVNRKGSDQIVDALKKNHISVTYLVYTNEGHGFLRPENRMSYHALVEKFLKKCLGGRAEPMTNEIEASSVQILAYALNTTTG